MPILNYTTEVESSKSIALISEMLMKSGATHVLTELENRQVVAFSFQIETEHGVLSFRLPADMPRVYAILLNDRKIPPRYRSREQAQRVAWRITKDWLEAQLAMIQIGLVSTAQVFLPYAQNPETGETLYESLAKRGFPQLTLPDSQTRPQTDQALRHH